MTSVTPTKRIKLSKENDFIVRKNNIKEAAAESGFHSEIDISSSIADFSLPPVKRKSLAPRRASLQQISLNSTSDNNTQHSSGYSSLYSSSSNITTTESASSLVARTSRTPKKRKSEVAESDENFYNSFQFVSPVKIRKKDITDKNCAKLILKEKSSSENVILCSTPIRTNNKNTKWGKFRSFHPEKFQASAGQKSLDDEEPLEKIPCTPPIKSLAENSSINLSNLDFSNLSAGNFTHSIQQQDNIPANLHNLWTDDIKPTTKSVTFNTTTESQVKIDTNKTSSERKKFFNGRIKFDILGKLHAENNIAVAEILNYFDAETLLSVSHVSKEYRHMILTKRNYETKRINYLKLHRSIKENKLPSRQKALNATTENINDTTAEEKKKKKAFGDYNINISLTTKQKTLSPPLSPSSRRFKEMQQLIQSNKNKAFKRCPRCHRAAIINSIKIRNSPRKNKKRTGIYKLSQSATGRVQKRTRATFLSKTSIPDSFNEATISPQCVTLAGFDDELSTSPCDSPNSSGSDESYETDEIYEYGMCTGVGCSYKFCVKCNCKYHPRRVCGDLSPPSPSRQYHNNNNNNNSKILTGTKASRKSLKRLINY